MNLNKNSGITLVVLVITVVLLGILATVTISLTTESLTQSKAYAFISELEIVQQKVLVMNKEIELGTSSYEGIGTKYDDLDENKKQRVNEILTQNKISDASNYIYMSKEDLSKIGLKNIGQNVIISNENSIVYSYDGLELNGKSYYSIEEVNKYVM